MTTALTPLTEEELRECEKIICIGSAPRSLYALLERALTELRRHRTPSGTDTELGERAPLAEEVERVAKAILHRDWSPCLWTPDEFWNQAAHDKRAVYRTRALAAIIEISCIQDEAREEAGKRTDKK